MQVFSRTGRGSCHCTLKKAKLDRALQHTRAWPSIQRQQRASSRCSAFPDRASGSPLESGQFLPTTSQPADSVKPGSSYLVGLIGSGIQASRTPSMHEQEAAAQGLRCEYRLIDLEQRQLGRDALPDLLKEAEALGFTGLNITYPCKQSVMALLHELSDDARVIGAVNTVVLADGKRAGHNTDWSGFANSFRRDLGDVNKNRVVQLGAGGAGAAVAHAMLTLGAGQLSIFDL